MTTSSPFRVLASPGMATWLAQQNTSLAFSTYQLGKLFFVGRSAPDRLSVFERTFNRCLGLWTDTQTLWLAAAYQLWRLENVLEDGTRTEDGYDRLFVPSMASTTGDVDAHDLMVDQSGQVVFVNTLFSCLARPSDRLSFEPIWQPPFVDQLAAEDRCHLNGLASSDGVPRFVTACAPSNTAQGWRQERATGGCVLHIESKEVVARGLAMPHSPRIYRDQLWVLNSGTGYFGRIDLPRGTFEPIALCPGYARGLAFINDFAIVGISKPREATFAGLPLDDELRKHHLQAGCGLVVIELTSGRIVEWIQIEGKVDELYDVVVLPGFDRPKALGVKKDDIRHNVWFADDSGKINRWTAHQRESKSIR